ncbi:MAG: hypothetical protein JWO62_1737 [Acidimicrobiaceae bacterium]|nr:hypothetical protein [Acidimicrobiaceae bacterium]
MTPREGSASSPDDAEMFGRSEVAGSATPVALRSIGSLINTADRRSFAYRGVSHGRSDSLTSPS